MKTITHAKQLSINGRDIEFPFEITLPNGWGLVCKKAFRVLPKKRMTVLALLNSKPVIVKIFYSTLGHHYQGKRDSHGIQLLVNAKINTPALLYTGYTNASGIYAVVLEYLSEAQNFHAIWKNSLDMQYANACLRNIMQMLATMHKAGIVHNDLHLDNFLVNARAVYAIDGEKITRCSRMLSDKQSLKNVAWFLVHLQTDKAIWLTAFKEYCQARQWEINVVRLEQFEKILNRARRQHHIKIIRKIFRDCTAIVAQKNFFAVKFYKRNLDNSVFQQLIENPEQWMDPDPSKWLKAGNSASVCGVRLADQQYVIKRYNIKDKKHAVKRAFQASRAAISWRNAHYLELLKVNTPKPLAMIEHRCGFLRQRAFFITEFIAGKSLLEYFKQTALPSNWHHIATAMIDMLHKLYAAGFSHGDLKATNFIIQQDEIFMLDLDAMHYHHSALRLKRAWQKDCQRFLQNWETLSEVQHYFKQLLVARGLMK